MKIARESWIIALIGLADLITTIVFIRRHGAEEANPLFRLLWEQGLPVFILGKLACLVGPIAILEWARRRTPRFVVTASRCVIVAYVACYGLGVAKLNPPVASAESRPTLVMYLTQEEREHIRLPWAAMSSPSWRERAQRQRRWERELQARTHFALRLPPPGF